jgi:DNA-binding SARP family transcriptional activator/streptogramin lyase
MEFRILGPLEIYDESLGAIPIDAPKERTVVGVLLLHPNEPVSSDRLIDEVWGERPPATATKTLQTYVSHLRRTVGADAIETRPPGYVLHVGEDGLDAARFKQLTTEARDLAAKGEHEHAAARYADALALWRGPPLAGTSFESFAANEVERLAEERLSAQLDLIDCELASGRHAEVVPELEMLAGRYPLRERLHAQLMLALYRSGRQADALAVYHEARRRLTDELGLEPGSELRELQKAVLSQDPSLAAPAPNREVLASPRRRWYALAAGLLAALALTTGLAFALDNETTAAKSLAPNSVGFIDADTGRVTKSFPVANVSGSLVVTNGSVWIGNYRDQTITRVDPTTGRTVTIPIGAHPAGIASLRRTVWVWTLERSLIPIDMRFNSLGAPIKLAAEAETVTPRRGVTPAARRAGGGRLAAGGGYLWVTLPSTAVIRVDPVRRLQLLTIVPDNGAEGAIAYRDGNAWVAGYDHVFSIAAQSGIPDAGIVVGHARDLTFGDGSLWVVSGGRLDLGVAMALRRVDLRGRLVDATIEVDADPVAVAFAGGSIWVASRGKRTVQRVDPVTERVVETIALGAIPTALGAGRTGVWVAVR